MISLFRKRGAKMSNPCLILEPWSLSLDERLQIFHDSKKRGKKIALYYAKAPDNTTFRYRVYNVFQITKQSRTWQAVFFFKDEINKIKEVLPKADLLVLSRQSRWGGTVEQLEKCAKNNSIPILFDLDDLVFEKKYMDTVMNVIGENNNYSFWIPYIDKLFETAKRCDGYLATNDFLANKLSETFGKPCKIIRNSINEEQLAASNAYLALKHKEKARDGFSIGYFSGTPTHKNDLAVALPEIIEFLKKHPDTTLKITGYMDLDDNVMELLAAERIVFLPVVDFRKLQYRMSEVDVNIAPLVKSIFTDCKSELKFFEAAIVETTTIASPTYTFSKAITNGKNGFLAWPGEWFDILERLYEDRELNRAVAKKARKYAIEHYCGKDFLKEVESSFNFFVK